LYNNHIEKTIKYLVNLKAGYQPWGHDIGKLIRQADQYKISIPSEIANHQNTYTSWEAVTRYYPTKIIRRDSIEKAIKVVRQWHEELAKNGIK